MGLTGVSPVDALRMVAAEARAAIQSTALPTARLAAVGAVLPGLTDFHTGVCLLAPNLGWRDVPVRDILAAELGAPVYVHNAGQAAAVAENLEGAGGRVGDLALLYAGTGLSAGVLSDGRVFHGVGGTAGEIGHNAVPGNEEPCNCGKVGCLETVASGPAIVRAVRRALAAGRLRAWRRSRRSTRGTSPRRPGPGTPSPRPRSPRSVRIWDWPRRG
ncbi:hypothetical protein GCM10027610_140040 [Dactylosporangium cerinum]